MRRRPPAILLPGPALLAAEDLEFDTALTFAVEDGGFLFHFGSDGALTVEFGAAGSPAGLALDRTTGDLYVCDPGNHRVAAFKT